MKNTIWRIQHSRLYLCIRVGMIAAVVLVYQGCTSSKTEGGDTKIQSTGKTKPLGRAQASTEAAAQVFTVTLNELLRNPDPVKRADLIERIEKGREAKKIKLFGNEVAAVNISEDYWTINGEPGALLIENRDDKEMIPEIHLGCAATEKGTYPLTAVIEDGSKKTEHVYASAQNKVIRLSSVPPKTKKLYIIITDKTWIPGIYDQRRLGVRLGFSLKPLLQTLLEKPNKKQRSTLLEAIINNEISDYMALFEPYLTAVGLDSDGWIRDQSPAGLVINNVGKKHFTPQLTLSCKAEKSYFPITVTLDNGKHKVSQIFKEPGVELVTLPKVSPGSNVFYIVSTDKSVDSKEEPGDKYGVRITNFIEGTLRQLLAKPDPELRARLAEDLFTFPVQKNTILGDVIISTGLSGDRWTVGQRPAGIAVRNRGNKPLDVQARISCNAANPEHLPITAIVDGGQSKQKLIFDSSGEKTISFSAVPPGSEKLFIITTDRTWTPGTHDKRQLGVNVQINTADVVRSLIKGASKKTREEIVDAIINGNMQEKIPLLSNNIVALGLTEDHWTIGEPIALAVKNDSATKWQPKLVMRVAAMKVDLPATVLIDDGTETEKIIFSKSSLQLVTLQNIAPGQKKLFMVNTDKTWLRPGDDARELGVNISIPPKLKSMLPGPR